MLAMVMIMAVIVLVIVTTILVVIMVVVIMVVVIVAMMTMLLAMLVAMRLMMVGPTLRLERAFDLDHLGAKPSEHVGDDVIVADAQPFRPDLGFEMPVAKMPGQPHLVQPIAALDLEQRLRFGDDLDQPPIFEHISIAMGERRCLGEIDQHFKAAHRGDHTSTSAAILKGQHDAVGDGFEFDLGGGHERMGVEHETFLERFAPSIDLFGTMCRGILQSRFPGPPAFEPALASPNMAGWEAGGPGKSKQEVSLRHRQAFGGLAG